MTVMCNLCYPDCDEIGLFLPSVALIRLGNGKYALLGEPGHRDDHLLYVFNVPPCPDPYPEWEGWENDDPRWQLVDEWSERVDSMPKMNLDLMSAWMFIDECKQAGYDQRAHGFVDLWIWNRAGEILNGRKHETHST